jgi:hypothetical protein
MQEGLAASTWEDCHCDHSSPQQCPLTSRNPVRLLTPPQDDQEEGPSIPAEAEALAWQRLA